MRIRFSVFSFALVFSLTGCISLHINDNDVMMPDRLTGYQVKKPFNNDELKKHLPLARLKTESVAVSPEISLAGLSILQDQAQASVLFFPGGGDHVDNAAKTIASTVGKCAINISLYDNRGFGRSAGEHTMERMKEDALRLYDELRAKTKGSLIVHGYSMGSFMAAHVAQHRQPNGLILQATANTMGAAIDSRIPAWTGALIRFDLADGLRAIDNVKAVSHYTGKSLVIAGELDTKTPPALGRLVFDAIASKEKRFLLVKDGTHSNLLQSEEVKSAYCSFIGKYVDETSR
jgi:pimeloyl-ACP methyl ester carboxylesterase